MHKQNFVNYSNT